MSQIGDGPFYKAIGEQASGASGGNFRKPNRREFLIGSGISILAMTIGIRNASGQAKQKKIGFILPDKGPYADEAASLLAGFYAYYKGKGSLPAGLDLIKKSSGAGDEKTLESLTDLVVNNKVDFLITSPSLTAAEQILHGSASSDVVVFVTNPIVRLVSGEMCRDSVFRVCPNTYQLSEPSAPWALTNLGHKSFIITDESSEAQEFADFFAFGFERAGGVFVDRTATGAKGISSALERAAKSGAEFIFASFTRDAPVFLESYKKTSSKMPLLGPESLLKAPRVLSNGANIPGAVYSSTTLKGAAEFAANAAKLAGMPVKDVYAAATGFDIAGIINLAVKSDADREYRDIIKAIEGMTLEGPRGKISFDKNHEPVMDILLQKLEKAGTGLKQTIVADLGSCRTADFGCGRVGFPKKPESDIKEEETIWDDREDKE